MGADRRLPTHWKVLGGFLAGLVLGLGVYCLKTYAPALGARVDPWVTALTVYGTRPAATIFLRLVFMLVLPLLFSALVLGVLEMGSVRAFGRIGGRTLAITAAMSALAVALGMILVALLEPGAGIDPAVARDLISANADRARDVVSEAGTQPTGIDMLVSIVPDNIVAAASKGGAILSVMFFAVMFGVGLMLTRTEGTDTLRRGVQGLFAVSMTLMSLVLRLAPYAVACMMFNMTAAVGASLLRPLAGYVAVVVLGLALHLFVVYALALRLVGGWSPLAFFRAVREAMLLAFSTASSNATLPTALRIADERLHLPSDVSRFVLTMGATANQNGTALFEGVTVLFLAQVFDVELTIGQSLVVMLICVLGGIGTAGIPGASLPVIAMMMAMYGIPAEGLALILGVDRLLDMCRTTVNVAGDLVVAACVARGEPVASGDEALER